MQLSEWQAFIKETVGTVPNPYVVVFKDKTFELCDNSSDVLYIADEKDGCAFSLGETPEIFYGYWNLAKNYTQEVMETNKYGEGIPHTEVCVYLTELYHDDEGYVLSEPLQLKLVGGELILTCEPWSQLTIKRGDIPELIEYLQHYIDTGELLHDQPSTY